MSEATQQAVEFEDVVVHIGGVNILDQVTAKVPIGSSTAIVGPNGAGKTTLLLALLEQIHYEGQIRITPSPTGRSARIGYVPQGLQFDRGIPLTVMEFMVMGLQRRPLWFGSTKAHKTVARKFLAAVKMDAFEDRPVGALSGGELQRVLLALALEQDPDLLVLDEPAAGVDVQGEHVFCGLLDSLRQQKGFTQLMVSHDLATVAHHSNHVICLNKKVAAEGPPEEVLTTQNLTAVFGPHMGVVDAKHITFEDNECDCCLKRCHHDRP